MSKLTLLLAWVAPLWTVEYLGPIVQFSWKHIGPDYKPEWAVRFEPHHFSKSPSLRVALCAALRKLGQDRPAKTQPTKI